MYTYLYIQIRKAGTTYLRLNETDVNANCNQQFIVLYISKI